MQNLNNALALEYFKFSKAALECIEETDPEVLADMDKVRSGLLSRETLLMACLDGADDDRTRGWRDYVDEIVRVAQSPSIIEIVSGEGEGEGVIEAYDGKRTAKALLSRLAGERLNGERWAFAKFDGVRADETDIRNFLK